MRNAPIVAGVPNPFFYKNRVYPSRFAGGIWTRPVFSAEQGRGIIARNQSHFTPGYNIDREVPQPMLSGLGEVNAGWDTGSGVFKPGGYGGGVFDGDISGLGSIGTRRVHKTRHSGFALRGLGDDTADYPWKEKSAKTAELQTATNASLAKAGMCPITVDGKLGGSTCGARNFLTANSQKLLGQEMLFANPSACDAHSGELVRPKSKASGCGGGTLTTTPAASTLPATTFESGMSSGTKRMLGFAIGGVLALGAVVMMRRSR